MNHSRGFYSFFIFFATLSDFNSALVFAGLPDVALNKPVSATSEDSGHKAWKAVDGSIASGARWVSEKDSNFSTGRNEVQFITVDLGASYTLYNISVDLGNDLGKLVPSSFRITSSLSSNKEFQSVEGGTFANNVQPLVSVTLTTPVISRYVRARCFKTPDGHCRVRELRVAGYPTPVIGNTKYGALIGIADPNLLPNKDNGDDIRPEVEDKIAVGKSLGIQIQRITVSVMSFNGKSPVFEELSNAGFKIQLNLDVGNYPDDMAKYRAQIESILTLYTPELVAIENETTLISHQFYSGTVAQYIDQLRNAVEVIKKVNLEQGKSIKVTNDGIVEPALKLGIYAFLYDSGRKSEASAYALENKIPDQRDLSQWPDPDMQARQQNGITLIDGLASIDGLDYANFHWYGASGTSLQNTIRYFREASGKDVVSNESGVTDIQSLSTLNRISDFYDVGSPYMIYYSGDFVGGANAKSLYCGGSDILRSNGTAFRDFILSK